jgi:ABC-type transport system involved in multi-copper enzyme maturation permease subunit
MVTPLSGIVLLSFRELWAKKVVIGLFVVSTLVLLMTAFALNLDVVEGSLAGIRLFGAEVSGPGGNGEEGSGSGLTLETVVFSVQAVVAGAAYWIGTLLALFSTAPLFTSMLEPGHVDLLLAKPLSRMQLFAGHIVGVAITMLILATYLLGGVWLIMSIKTGIWNPSFLLSIGIVLAMFGVMYSVIVFTGVWTQSTALALIVTYGLIFISLFLAGGEQLASQLQPGWRSVFWGFYHVLPNFAEVTQTVSRLSRAEPITSWYPFISSSVFGLVLYGGAATWFARRDF